MFFFINKILGTLIAGILYPLLITAPLQILNGVYQAFSICCGASIGAMFFNQHQGSIAIDVNAPIFKFLIRGLIISLILMVIMIIILGIEHLVTKKKINLLSKIKWPMIAITSTVTIPLAFMLMSSLSVAFMSLVGGSTIKIALLTANVSDIVTNMTRGIETLSGQTIQIKLVDASSKEFTIQLQLAIDKLREAIIEVSKDASKAGLQDLVEKCRLTSNYLEEMSKTLSTWKTSIADPFNNVMAWINNPANWNGNAVKYDNNIANQLKNIMNQLNVFQSNWTASITNIADIAKDANIYCHDAMVREITIIDSHSIKIGDLLNSVTNSWTNNAWGEFNSLWIDQDKTNPSLWTCMLEGGTWKETIVFSTDKQCYLNTVSAGVDPQTNNTYNLVIQIYQLVTGNKDTNWTGVWNMSKPLDLINVGVGFIIIVGSIFVTGLFGLMAARRLIELAILAVSADIFAIWGIRDDGAKFTNCIKLVVAKMFSIVMAYGAFIVGINLLQTISNFLANNHQGISSNSFAWGCVQAIIMVGGLLGAYHIAILLQQWMGDSTSIQGTLADMGAMSSMMQAGKVAGLAIGGTKLLGKAAGGVASKVGDKKSLNLMKYAQDKGMGKIQYSVGRNGKVRASGFKFNDEYANTKGLKALTKGDNKKEFKLWKQENKDLAKFNKGQELLAKGKTSKGNKLLDKLQDKQMGEVWKNLEKKGK